MFSSTEHRECAKDCFVYCFESNLQRTTHTSNSWLSCKDTLRPSSGHFIKRIQIWNIYGKIYQYWTKMCVNNWFYNWEDMSVLLILVTSSQPCLIFRIFFLKHGRNSIALQNRTTIGRKTAIIKVGGVYHTNCFISTHLFQAKINACIVPSRRETVPSLLCKRKKNDLVGIGWIRIYSILPLLFCCLEIPSYICNHFPIIFLNIVHSHLSIFLTHSPPPLPYFWWYFAPSLFKLRKFTINLSTSANQ